VFDSYYLKLILSSPLLTNQPTYVMAKSNIKDRFALGVPSVCTEKLSMMFHNQLATLNEIVKSEQDLEAMENKVCFPLEEFVHLCLIFIDLLHKRMVNRKCPWQSW